MQAVRNDPAGRLTDLQASVGVLLGAAALAIMLPIGFRPLDTSAQVASSAVSLTLLYLGVLRFITGLPEGAGGISRWRLGPWFVLYGSISFGVATLSWLGPQQGSAATVELASVASAVSVVGMAVVLWAVGYFLGPPRAVRRLAVRGISLLHRGTSPVVRGGAMPWLLYGIGSSARLLTVALSGRLGYVGDPSELVDQAAPYDQLLTAVTALTLLAVAAAAYHAFRAGTPSSMVALLVLVTLEIGVGALAGGKQSFLMVLLAVLIPYAITRGRPSLWIVAAGVLIFLWLAVPFNNAYRDAVRGGDTNLTPQQALQISPELAGSVSTTSAGPTIVASAEQILHRIRMIDNVAIVVQRTPDPVAYRSPYELLSAPVVGLVPRAIWPQKPVFTRGYEFSQEYYDLPSSMYTASSITPLGDLYRHGGLLPVAAGMVLLGMALRLFDMLFQPERDPRAICYLLVFLPQVVKFEIDMYSLILGVPAGVLTAALGVRLMFARQQPAGGRV